MFQRRWATGEAEAQNSETQPTPQEEVENAVHEDSVEVEAAASTESGTIETTEELSEKSTIEPATNAASETTSDVATSFQGAAASATSAASAETGFGDMGVGRSRPRDSVTEPKPTIYVGNLFFDVTENDLVKEMARFGTISKCRLMRDARGLSKGWD